MFDTSKDILYLVISLCVLLVTVFFVWIMYYLAMILKDVRNMITDVKNKIESFGEILDTIKDKAVSSATVLTTLGKGLADLIGMFRDRRAAKWDEEPIEVKEKKKKPRK